MAENSKRQAILAIVAVIAIIVAVVIATGRGSQPTPGGIYYYDLNAKALVVAQPGKLPLGEHMVQAAVFACSTCDDASTHFVGYLTKESEELRQVLASGEPPSAEQMQNGQLLRLVDKDKWVSSSSPEGMEIANKPVGKCADPLKPATICKP